VTRTNFVQRLSEIVGPHLNAYLQKTVDMRFYSASVIVLAASLALAGCGGRDIPLVAINGKLTFGGARPPKDGKIVFSPVEGSKLGMLARPGNADFAADGSFTVTTFSPGDGLIPGKYRASVLCFRETPTLDNYQQVSFVPTDYNPEVTIPDSVNSFEVTLDVPATRLSTPGKK
jgi:hypothetical protein